MKKRTSFLKTFIYLLFLCCIIMIFGALFVYVDGMSKSFVHYGSVELSDNVDNFIMPVDTYVLFNCTDSFGNAVDYDVKIIQKEGVHDFNYDIDTSTYAYCGETSLTAGFDIVRCDGYFALFIPKEITMHDILQNMYSEYTVRNVPNVSLRNQDSFTMVITSQSKSVFVSFHLA